MKYFLTLIFNPQRIYQQKNMRRKKMLQLFLGLNLLIVMGLFVQIIPTIKALHQDAIEVSQNIPDFAIDADHYRLVSDEEGFAYQTPSILFFFDPKNDVSSLEVEDNHHRLDMQLTLALHNDQVQIILDHDALSQTLSYQQLAGFSKELLIQILSGIGKASPLMVLLTSSIGYLIAIPYTLLHWVIATFITYLIAFILRVPLNLKESRRMALVASFLPLLTVMVFEMFSGSVPYSFELSLLFITLLIFGNLYPLRRRKRQK